ncbi:MAG: hypothetical protein ACI8TL_001095 [Natronomonas sp.]|jgi:hypothetical protein
MTDRRVVTDRRAMTPVVGKTLAIGIVLLYIGGMTTVLLGGTVPEYRTHAGSELGDRVLATAGGSVEAAVTEANGTVETTKTVDLPPTIRERSYELELVESRLRLRHPDPEISGEIQLSLPPTVTVENSTWRSGTALQIRVSGPSENRTLTIDQ